MAGRGRVMEPLGTVLLVLLLVTASVFAGVWFFTRAVAVVERWAERNGYRIITQDCRSVFRGPFSGGFRNNYQAVYRITVEDRSGNRKSGWIWCGGDSILGFLLSDRVDEVWDDQT